VLEVIEVDVKATDISCCIQRLIGDTSGIARMLTVILSSSLQLLESGHIHANFSLDYQTTIGCFEMSVVFLY